MKIISGGQTGTDQAALDAALFCNLEIGGWCPPGKINEDGLISSQYPLQETSSDASVHAPHIPRSRRTEKNVADADATLVLVNKIPPLDMGTDFAIQCCYRYNKPLFIFDPFRPDVVENIIKESSIAGYNILNIAGPSEKSQPGIYETVYRVLVQVFKTFK